MVNVLVLAHFNSMLSQTEFSLIKNKEKLYLNLEKKKKNKYIFLAEASLGVFFLLISFPQPTGITLTERSYSI